MNYNSTDIKQLIIEQKNEEAKFIIQKYNLYNSVNIFRITLLHISVQLGNEIITNYLLTAGCNVNAQDVLGRTPLMYALTENHNSIIESLLKAGADVLITNNENESSLHLSFKVNGINENILKLILFQLKKQCSNIEEVAKRLIKAGGQLEHAIYLGDSRVLEYMLQQGYSANHVLNVTNRRTILHLAVLQCDIDCVKVLLKYKANVLATNIRGRTPMNYLYYEPKDRDNPNQIEILKALLDAGAMPMQCSPGIGFQIGCTLMYGPREAIRVLLERGSLDFKARDSANDNTVLHYLVRNTNSGIAEELEKYRIEVNVNVFDRGQLSPLHWAANVGNVEMLKYLLAHGAEINIVDGKGCTPLFSALINSNPDLEYVSDECVEILLQRNIDPQVIVVVNDQQFTIFDLQIKATSKSVVDRLKPVVAQVALLRKSGTVIAEIINAKINARVSLRKYFKSCLRILAKRISGKVTVLKLLTANEKIVARCLKKRKLVLKLMRMSHMKKIVATFPYYRNILLKRITKVFLYKNLKDKAAIVVTQLLEYRFDESNVVTEKIISYLSKRDLLHLYQM